MSTITLRIDPDQDKQLSELAIGYGGKSAFLRSLIRQALNETSAAKPPDWESAALMVPLQTRVRPDEKQAVAIAAQERGMLPSQWVRCVVRRELETKASWPIDDAMKDAATALVRKHK